ncbi:hypothetical protein R80B4_00377 [Fibrobacteres bacterium R8-0-B4]
MKLDAKKAVSQADVHRLWAQKKIAELDSDYEKNRAELTELGRRFGIVTRNTSLIVLETVDDYIRYDIDPPAELLAEYRRRLKGREERQRGEESDMLAEAKLAAANIRKWRSTYFRPKKHRYPVPDVKTGDVTASQFAKWIRGKFFDERVPVTGRSGASYLSGGFRTGRRDTAVGATDRSKSMAFENAEIMGYLDNPTPRYIIDPDDPNADPVILDDDYVDSVLDIDRVLLGVGGLRSGGSSSDDDAHAGIYHEDDPPFMRGGGLRSGGSDGPSSTAADTADLLLRGLTGGSGGGLQLRMKGSLSIADTAQRRGAPKSPTVTVKTIRNDKDYMKKLTGNTAEDYKTYLKLRSDYANSPTFYFDMAEWFYSRGDKKLALRVLTSIADLDLENASLYRLLGYRLKEYGEYALEEFVCRKVVQWRPMDPQSFRDYALALADNGKAQAALDSLCALLTKKFNANGRRAVRIEEVIVTEINRLTAKNGDLNKSRVDTCLITDVSVDVRVVINWNMNNTDIDLHVTDPNGEECYYKHRLTAIGGRVSGDNTSGYGPEQFLLKRAVKGKYRIFVDYYNDTKVTADGPATVMAEIYTKYAGKTEQRRVVCLQLSKAEKRGDMAEVAEFEF